MSLGSVRLCFAPIPLVFDVTSSGRLEGISAAYVSCLFSKLKHINHSFVRQTTFGDLLDPETRAYDGCIGSMQRNESDVGMLMIDLPILAGDRVTQGEVAGFEEPRIISSFALTFKRKQTDVMDAFDGFPPGVWAVVAVACLLLSLLLAFLLRRKEAGATGLSSLSSAATMVWTYMVHQPSSSGYQEEGASPSFNLTFALMAMFTFLVTQFFSALIGTEMVVSEKPATIESYHEILRRNTSVTFMRALSDHWSFVRAKRDSDAGRIWSRVLADYDHSFLDVNLLTLKRIIDEGLQQKTVLMSGRVYGRAFQTNLCAFCDQMNRRGFAFLLAKDASAEQRLRGMIVNSLFAKTDAARVFLRRMKWNFEGSIETSALKDMDFSMFAGSRFGDDDYVRLCTANQVLIPESQVTAPSVDHYTRLFLWTSVGLLTAFLAFAMERLLRPQSLTPATEQTRGKRRRKRGGERLPPIRGVNG